MYGIYVGLLFTDRHCVLFVFIIRDSYIFHFDPFVETEAVSVSVSALNTRRRFA